MTTRSYITLEKIFKKLYDINSVKALLYWDTATVMPSGGIEARSDQFATLTSLHHAVLADESVGELLATAYSKKLSGWEAANLREMKRHYAHATAVPRQLLVALARKGAQCEMVWRTARANNDFKSLVPHLKEVVALVRDIAQAKADALQCKPYQALLDQYDPGRSLESLEGICDQLKGFFPEFIQKAVAKQKEAYAGMQPLEAEVPVGQQKEFARKMLGILCFDWDHGRLDESTHPFCGGIPSDIRLTTRYDGRNIMPGLMGIFHEGGHAMYERNLPKKWEGQPLGEAQGMSLHESQSLIIEMQACRSEEFLSYLLPEMKGAFALQGNAWTVDNVYRNLHSIRPSFIRVDADEVTYPAHILLRFYIEQYLINKEMEVEDLPDAWAQGMEKFLGVAPANDSEGCMQDIHWMDGTFGYFPTYLLGAMSAVQLFQAAIQQDASIMPGLKEGKFLPLMEWLREKVHMYGAKYTVDKILEQATGKPLDVALYTSYLEKKYL